MELFGGKKSGKHASGGKKNKTAVKRTDTQYSARPARDPEEFTDREVRRGGHRWLKGVLIAIGVIAALVLGAYIWLKVWSAPPDISANNPTTHNPQTTQAPGETAPPAETQAPIDAEAPEQLSSSDRRDGVYTFAIMGVDVEGNHMDTNILGMFDTAAGKLNFVTIPRDTLINTGWDQKKINYVYPASINTGADALQNQLDAYEDLLGYPVDCYAMVDITAAADLINAVGGVWFDLPIDMHYDGWNQDPPIYIDLKAGYQLLSGEDAVKVYRYRYTTDASGKISGGYPGGDVERVQTQYALLRAMMEQMLTLGNIPNLSKAISIYEEKVTTNLSASNLAFFAQEFLKLSGEDITFQTFPGDPGLTLYNISYINPYINDWLELVNGYFNPFSVEITRANVDMIAYNVSTDEFVSTQGGGVRGGRYSFFGAQ